jgi:protein-S-isoprenylcysteine O-methyltransferase Ste14
LAAFRFFIGVLMLVTVPPAIGLWYLIHPFARHWRRVGPAITYLILSVPMVLAGVAIWMTRDALLGADLGTSVPLILLASLCFAVGTVIAVKRRKHLTHRILVGVPELSNDKGRLLTEGIYASTRNPRYIEFLVFVLGYVAIANYLGTWILFAVLFPATHLLVLFEERELRERFGSEYDDYCRRVPRYIPRRPAHAAP